MRKALFLAIALAAASTTSAFAAKKHHAAPPPPDQAPAVSTFEQLNDGGLRLARDFFMAPAYWATNTTPPPPAVPPQ